MVVDFLTKPLQGTKFHQGCWFHDVLGEIKECVVTEPVVQVSIKPSVPEVLSIVLSADVISSDLPWLEAVHGH
jgi:hypothetical protein